jgi:glyoxylase-like metal-dependent hydrolase (beta-lactamase superfamily II)
VVIRTGGKLALIDTGMGEAGFIASKGVNGLLKQNLEAIGIGLDQIDTVIISHYHGDHVNGLVKPDGSLGFPNAEILVPAVEHNFWMDDGEMSRAPKGRMEGLFKNNRRVFSGEVLERTRTYEWDKEVLPGITAVGTPGHSYGHTSYVVASGADKVFVQSDVTNVHYLFVRYPHWHPFYDQDPVQAEATRRKVYDMLVAEKMMVQAFHFPFPSRAHVEKDGDGYRAILAG